MHDAIIIGAGPAGLTASIYLARKKIDFLLISKDVGGQALLSSDVENYLGYHLVSGAELVKKFQEHLEYYKIKIRNDEVVDIKKKGKIITVVTDKGKYECKTLVIASGKKPRRLEISGEKEFLGRGVTHCATCDAPLFTEKNVAVVGSGNSALDAVLQLTKIANKIYLLNRWKKLTADNVMIEKAKKNDKVKILNETNITKIIGDKFVSAVEIEKKGRREKIAVSGVFIEIGTIPNVEFAKIVKKNKRNEIMISRCTEMFKENMTSVPGIFAAGDVTDIPEKQIIVAAGEGAKAALAAADYLSKMKD
ncbi:MAG: FAD-dependent oxidoreductase [Candidatus Aenigmatarchaeota archaeon]